MILSKISSRILHMLGLGAVIQTSLSDLILKIFNWMKKSKMQYFGIVTIRNTMRSD